MIGEHRKQASMSAREAKDHLQGLNQNIALNDNNETAHDYDSDQRNMMDQFGTQPITARMDIK